MEESSLAAAVGELKPSVLQALRVVAAVRRVDRDIVQVGGQCNFAGGLQIAQLALKHRKNKNGGQRIVMFVGSPLLVEDKRLKKIAPTSFF